MNITQNGNALKIIAFFLVGVILLCLFGFTVDGWQLDNQNNDPSKETTDAPSVENTVPKDPEPEIYIPEFVDPLTGIETNVELSNRKHLAFIIDAESPLYGISNSDIIIEFPIESGHTRLACITNEFSEIGKIGSLSKTKDYISNVVSSFGSIIVANGKDSSPSYDFPITDTEIIDLDVQKENKYTEFNVYTYSNGALISSALKNSIMNDTYDIFPTLPYIFPDFGQEKIKGESVFNSINIPYSKDNIISFEFDQEKTTYIYSRNNTPIIDLLNGNSLNFTNCLVLFAASVTYEDSNGLEMVLKTNSYGSGYYLTDGTAKEITWEYSGVSSLTFYDLDGTKLVINRGTTYMAFVKSSEKNLVTLS